MKWLTLFFLFSCAHQVVSDGGQVEFDYDFFKNMAPEERLTYAQGIVKREQRNPEGVELEKLRDYKMAKINKIGIVLFESQIKPSRSGLASDRNVYLSEAGKQQLTEAFYRYFEFELKKLSKSMPLDWVHKEELEAGTSFRSYGSVYKDFLINRSKKLSEEDVFWKKGGEKVPDTSLVLPANMQDVSLLYVPSYDLLGGAKPSQHQHHWINEICKEHKIDALIVVAVNADWNRGGVDKRTKAIIPEVMDLGVNATIIYPWSTHHKILELKDKTFNQKLNMPLASYSTKAKIPVKLTLSPEEENFENAIKNIIFPLSVHTEALLSLVAQRIIADIYQTY